MKMNPLFTRHLIRIARKPIFYWLLSGYLLGVIVLVLLFTMTTSSGLYGFESNRTTTMFDQFTQGRTLFWVSGALLLLSAMLLVPIFALGLISSERDQRTYDLLITTTLQPMHIIIGKLLAVLVSGIVFILAPLPLLMIGVWLGGVTGTELAITVLMLLVTAVLCASLAIWLSGRVKRTLTAVLIYYGGHIASIPAAIIIILIIGNAINSWSYTSALPYQGMLVETLLQYGWLLLCAIHPLSAAIASETLALESGKWVILDLPLERTVPAAGFQHFGTVYLPSPWLLYTVGALILSILLIYNTARYLQKPRNK